MTQPIWFDRPTLEELTTFHLDSAIAHLGIGFTEVGDDYLKGRIPVDQRTKQPYGLLHGGAAVLLLETLASCAAVYCVDRSKFTCVGLEVNCNHLRSASSGFVTGTASAVHIGRTTMVWNLAIEDAKSRPMTAGRLTTMTIALP